MRLLVTGSQNNIAEYIINYFRDTHEIFAYTMDMLQVSNKNMCSNVITDIHPDVLIHLDSEDNIDTCERDESKAYTTNTIGTLNVAYPCSILNIPIIYLSTSYVYSGNKYSAFFETDDCTPVNIYGKTKLAGEKLIRTLCKKYFIIRCGWIFGQNNCFVEKIINNSNTPLFVCSKELGNPTYIEDLCRVIEEMLTSDLYGIYNCGNPPSITKSLWVQRIFDLLKIKKSILELPQNFIANSALRPNNSSLNTSLLKNCFNIELPSWEERLTEYINYHIS